MAKHDKSSLKRNRRWECSQVKVIMAPVDSGEWRYLLETLAQELYDLNHQLQDVGPIGSGENPRSYSLLHPSEETATLTPVGSPTGETGAWNGNESLERAA